MAGIRYLSSWLALWSGAYFVSHHRIPSPFLLNCVALVYVLFLHGSNDRDPQRFLFSVLLHILPLVLTLPPRVHYTDAIANAAVLALYLGFLCTMGLNAYEVYERYRDRLVA